MRCKVTVTLSVLVSCAETNCTTCIHLDFHGHAAKGGCASLFAMSSSYCGDQQLPELHMHGRCCSGPEMMLISRVVHPVSCSTGVEEMPYGGAGGQGCHSDFHGLAETVTEHKYVRPIRPRAAIQRASVDEPIHRGNDLVLLCNLCSRIYTHHFCPG